jgi:hypothetical protein
MARQKSEDRSKAQDHRKAVVTRRVEPRAGAEAIPVDEDPKQLSLFIGTAEVPARVGSDGVVGRPRGRSATRAVPKPVAKREHETDATIDAVTKGLNEAFSKVARNRGAPGPDGQTIDVMREHLEDWMPSLKSSLLEGSYMPGDIRRVWIPKAGGGQRGLGIPNVIDRVVQEAVRQVLEPMYEPEFLRRVTDFVLEGAVKRQLPRRSRMWKKGMSMWSTSIWRSSSIGSAING